MEHPKTSRWIVAAYALGAVFALPGPLLAVTLALASLRDSTDLFEAGHAASFAAAGTYALALVALGVLGSLFLRGRAVPPVALYAIALAPYFVAAGVALFQRHPIAADLGDVYGLVYAAMRSQAGLAIGASMSAFAMTLVAMAALVRRATAPRSPFGLLALSATSVVLVAFLAAYAYERSQSLDALRVVDPTARFDRLTHALSAMNVAWRAGVACVLVVAAGFVALGARTSGLRVVAAPRGSMVAMIALGVIAAATPTLVAMREKNHVAWTDVTVADIRLPVTRHEGRRPRASKLAFITRDGALRLDASRAKPDEFGHDSLAIVADRDVTYGMLLDAAPSLPSVRMSFQLAPAPDVLADVSSLGDFARAWSSASTTAEFWFEDWPARDAVHVLLDATTIRVWRTGYVDKTVPLGNEPGASAARRAVFASIPDCHDDGFVIAPRKEDKLETILGVVEDVRSTIKSTRPLAFELSPDRKTPEERLPDTSPFLSYTTTIDEPVEVGTVKKPAMTVHGPLPRDVVDRVLHWSFGSFAACYSLGVAKNPKLHGRVDFSFVIDPDGSVKSVTKTADTLGGATTVPCLVEAMKGVSFPSSANGLPTTVVTTLAFARLH